MTSTTTTTPMMKQWYECKEKAKDALLLFRLGDFYEAFYNDASILATQLELTLTKRQGTPMSGIPVQTLDNYLSKLIAKGFSVAIAEQIEDPKTTKGIVKRDITRIVSPATYMESTQFDKRNQFFVCVAQINSTFGLAILDISTSELKILEVDSLPQVRDELTKLKPKELLVSTKLEKAHSEFFELLKLDFSFRLNKKEPICFDSHLCYEWLKDHFKVASLDGFGAKHMNVSLNAAGALLSFLSDELGHDLSHIQKISPVSSTTFMGIDASTFKNLEILDSNSQGGVSLFDTLNQTKTAMGSRLLYYMLSHPLLSVAEITQRHDAIEELISKQPKLQMIVDLLQEVGDIERLIIRIVSNYASPRDLKALSLSLQQIPPILETIHTLTTKLFVDQREYLQSFDEVVELIESAIVDSPPIKLTEGGIFKRGYNEEIDELLTLKDNSDFWLKNYQEKLREEIGIKTLKVSFNRAFGYYIEVSRLQAKNMPSHFHKTQTLVNTERFISDDLKAFETKILHAEQLLEKLEYEHFQLIKQKVAKYETAIKHVAESIAKIDCIQSFAIIALSRRYTRPKIGLDSVLKIEQGRHPTLEFSKSNEIFVPNDTYLDDESAQMMIITGPNMAGKSTYIRQVALLCIMAQVGSFVPAKSAQMSIIDKVFSRIGASDDLSRGQSTFMVEMSETANILHNASDRSLVILDEIGRGTSTYDGVSIAWAVAEFLLSQEGRKAKTLFATHYHELTSLQQTFPKVKNYKIAVDETGDNITFLRKIVEGGSDKSYGIHVAKLAGLPQKVLTSAKQKLKTLEIPKPKKTPSLPREEEQFLLFPVENNTKKQQKVLEELCDIEFSELTPLAAMEYIFNWQKQLKK